MLIVTVLRAKGDFVATVPPAATVRDLLDLLAEHRIGAVVVVVGRRHRRHRVGARRRPAPGGRRRGRCSTGRWPSIMTVDVVTCTRARRRSRTSLATMTERRIRHVPVVDDDGALVGIVSIGDVVKSRISELEGERDDLVGYIGAR